jgi:hypothetical protein
MYKKSILIALSLFSFNSLAKSDAMDGTYECEESNLVSIIKGESNTNEPRKFKLMINGGVIQITGDEVPYTLFNLLDDIHVSKNWIYARHGMFKEFFLTDSHFKMIFSNIDSIRSNKPVLVMSTGSCEKLPESTEE